MGGNKTVTHRDLHYGANRRARPWMAVLCLLLWLLMGGCAGKKIVPGEGSETEFDSTTFSFDQGTYPTELGLFPNYRLAPGDMLDVLFQFSAWQEKREFRLAVDTTLSIKFVHIPELNQTRLVQPDGRISMPYIGEIYVVGKTIDELTRELKQAYSKELVNPELYVTVDEFQAGIKELKKDLHTAPRGLSRLVTVRPDGYTTFPLVGDVFVAQKTIPQVNDILNDLYAEKMPGLHVDLFLEKHSASAIIVAGEVNKPGPYTITRPVTVLEAVSMASGTLSSAALDRLVVVRQHNKKFVAHTVNLGDLMEMKSDSAFFHLRPDDIVFVPKRGISKAADMMDDIRKVILFDGWSIGLSGPLFDEPILGNPNRR